METGTREWAEKVATIYQRILSIETERQTLEQELESMRAGIPLISNPRAVTSATATLGSSKSPGSPIGVGNPTATFPGVSVPTGGISKDVYNYVLAHPGVRLTPGQVVEALGLDLEKKSAVNTALSRLRRDGLLEHPATGEYLYPGESPSVPADPGPCTGDDVPTVTGREATKESIFD